LFGSFLGSVRRIWSSLQRLLKAVSLVTPPNETDDPPRITGTVTSVSVTSVPYLTHKARGTVGAP